jgi:hypothetical protein
MAFAIPFGNAKFSLFDPGDSILKSTSLLGAMQEVTARYAKAVQYALAANPALTLAVPDTNVDPESGSRTVSFSLLAKRKYVTATNSFVNEFRSNVADYSGWVVPTTGNLVGCPDIETACDLIFDAIKYCYNLVTPNLIINDPSQYATVTEDRNGLLSYTNTVVVDESFNPTTGLPTFTIFDFLKELDTQQGV